VTPIESFSEFFRTLACDAAKKEAAERRPPSAEDIAEYQAKVAAHDARMLRRANPVVNAASRARLKYEASAKGQATRAKYTNSVARLESKERYRSTTWGMHARYMWQLRNRIAGRGVEIDEGVAS
jgi:hypothetical protein